MKKIELLNFLNMLPEIPQYSPKNQHYLLAGVNPLYYLDIAGTTGVQEQQLAPLAASVSWSLIATTDGNVVCMIPATGGSYTGVFLVDDTGKVYSQTATTLTSLGYPTGSALTLETACQIATAGGYIFFTHSNSTSVYYSPIGGSWSALTSAVTVGGVHLMEPFLAAYLTLVDGPGSGAPLNTVKLINYTSSTPTILSTPTLVLGKNWGIMGTKNYNNKYLAIAAGQSATAGATNGYSQNYIFLWDGVAPGYNFSAKIPGQYIDMKVIDSVLYVAVQVANGKTVLYKLVNTFLRKVKTSQYMNMSTGIYGPISCTLFDFKNYVGIRGFTTTDLANPLMVYGQDEQGVFNFIHSYGTNFNQISPGYDGNIYGCDYNLITHSNIYFLSTTPPAGQSYPYQNIFYRSQWIDVQNATSLEIEYDSPPVVTTLDTIQITIYGRGDNILTGTSTTVLNVINSTNTRTAKGTTLDLEGFVGSQIMVQLTTNLDPYSTWVPIIRGITLITK